MSTSAQWAAARAYARANDPQTSHQAAASVNVSELDRKVLDSMKRLGRFATTDEIVIESGLEAGSVTPRMKHLEKAKLVRRTGSKRPSRRNRPQIIWELI